MASSTKPEPAERIALSSDEDRAAAIYSYHVHVHKLSRSLDMLFLRYASGQTDRYDTLITVLLTPTGRRSNEFGTLVLDDGRRLSERIVARWQRAVVYSGRHSDSRYLGG